MADRATLHLKKLDDFAAFMARSGWTRTATKGYYEVLRLTYPGRDPLIFYTRAGAKEHATIQRGQQKYVRAYIRARKKDDAGQTGVD